MDGLKKNIKAIVIIKRKTIVLYIIIILAMLFISAVLNITNYPDITFKINLYCLLLFSGLPSHKFIIGSITTWGGRRRDILLADLLINIYVHYYIDYTGSNAFNENI